jgi:hypothetical protein
MATVCHADSTRRERWLLATHFWVDEEEIGACPGPVVQAATYSRFKGFGILVNYYLICRLGANHFLHGLVVLPYVPLPSLVEIMFWFGFKPRLLLVRRGSFSFSDSDYRGNDVRKSSAEAIFKLKPIRPHLGEHNPISGTLFSHLQYSNSLFVWLMAGAGLF